MGYTVKWLQKNRTKQEQKLSWLIKTNKNTGEFHQNQQLAWLNIYCSLLHWTTEPMFCKNDSTSTSRRTLWSWLTWQDWNQNHCSGSKTMSKGSSGPTHTCTGSYEIKSFGLTNQSLKPFGLIGGSMSDKGLVKEMQPPNHKVLMGLSFDAWVFANGKVMDLHWEKDKLNQTSYHSIMQYHAIPSGTQLVAQGLVLMQYNEPKHPSKLCQEYIKSNRNKKSLNWYLGRRNQ